MGFFKRISKGICTVVLVFTLMSMSLMPVNNARADLLEGMCSNGISQMMSDMGMMAYEWADFMSSMCQMMPFFGMFCPDPSEMAGAFFSAVLDDPQMTLEMMQCADVNSGMLDFMIDTIAKNPELLDKMAWIMRERGEASCAFTELFIDMAMGHDNLKDFFFWAIDDNLYDALTYSMSCNVRIPQKMAILVRDNAVEEMAPGTPFANAMMNMGSTGDSDDGNEMANERMFYHMFGDTTAATDFLTALMIVGQNSPETMKGFMDFIFLGIVQEVTDPGYTCREDWDPPWCEDEPPTIVVSQHGAQVYYNNYSIIRGFVEGVAPEYDMSIPPDPSSDNPANALFGNFMGMLVDQEGNMTDYAGTFFSAMVTGSQPPHCDPYCGGMMQMMMGLMQMGYVPFTQEQFAQMMPQLMNPEAPGPRNFLDGSGDDMGYECPPPDVALTISPAGDGTGIVSSDPAGIDCGTACSAEFPASSTVTLSVTSTGGDTFMGWSGACVGTASTCEVTMSQAMEVTAMFYADGVSCDADHSLLCTETTCGNAGLNWCGDSCHVGECPPTSALLSVSRSGVGTGIVTSSDSEIDCGDTCNSDIVINSVVILSAAPDDGSTFTGWSGDCSGISTCQVTMSEARAVTAIFDYGPTIEDVTEQFTDDVSYNGGWDEYGPFEVFTGSFGAYTETFWPFQYYNEVDLFVYKDNNDRTFSNADCESKDADPTESCTVQGPGIFYVRVGTLDGNWVDYTLDVSYQRGTDPVCDDAHPGLCTESECASLGDSWCGSVCQSAPCPVPLSVGIDGTGTGRVTTAPTGIDCSSGNSGPCSADFAKDGDVTLTAFPGFGSVFEAWGGACSATTVPTCVVTMDAAKDVTTTFNVAPDACDRQHPGECSDLESCTNAGNYWCGDTCQYDPCLVALSVSIDGLGSGEVTSNPTGITCNSGNTGTCSADFIKDGEVTLTASVAAGSVFGGWGESCSGSGSESTCVVTMSAATDVTATFNVAPNVCDAQHPEECAIQSSCEAEGHKWCRGSCQTSDTPCLVNLDVMVFDNGGTGSVSSNFGGITCSSGDSGTCNSAIELGDTVRLTAAPGQDSVAGIWGGSCSGVTGLTCDVIMDAEKIVSASFNPAPAECSEQNLEACDETGCGGISHNWCGGVCQSEPCQLNLSIDIGGEGSGRVFSDPIGIDCYSENSGTWGSDFAEGAVVRLTALQEDGSIFKTWGGACSDYGSGATCDVTMDEAKNVTATFDLVPVECDAQHPEECIDSTSCITASNYWCGGICQTAACPEKLNVIIFNNGGTGSVQSEPAGLTCNGGSCSSDFSTGETITLTAYPSDGSVFEKWTFVCSGSSNPVCEVTMDVPKLVVASFKMAPVTLSVDIVGDGTGTVTSADGGIDCGANCSADYPLDEVVTLSAAAAKGSSFVGWSGACSSSSSSCQVTMSEANTVEATFKTRSDFWPIMLPAILSGGRRK
jgi:Divergent InlB B-repeat domain